MAPMMGFSRCHQACFDSRRPMKGPHSSLPTPYSNSSKFGDSKHRALSRTIAARDTGRRFWTRLAAMSPTPKIRFLLSLIAPVTAALLLTKWEFASYEAAIAVFSILTLLLIPTNLAAAFAGMSARDRLKLRDRGQRSMDAYPGVERILNTLRERALRERIRLLSALFGALSITAVWNLDTGDTLGSLLLGGFSCPRGSVPTQFDETRRLDTNALEHLPASVSPRSHFASQCSGQAPDRSHGCPLRSGDGGSLGRLGGFSE